MVRKPSLIVLYHKLCSSLSHERVRVIHMSKGPSAIRHAKPYFITHIHTNRPLYLSMQVLDVCGYVTVPPPHKKNYKVKENQ